MRGQKKKKKNDDDDDEEKKKGGKEGINIPVTISSSGLSYLDT